MSQLDNIGQCPEAFSEGGSPVSGGAPETFQSFASRLDWFRNGAKQWLNEDTGFLEYSPLTSHDSDRRLLKETRDFILSRGELFRAPYPYYLDKAENRLIRLDGGDPRPEFAALLRRLHLLATQRDTKLIATNLKDIGEVSLKRDRHRLSYMSDSAIYLNAGNNRMVKITADNIEQVPMNTDGVVLIADDIAPWPSLEELTPLTDGMREKIGNACTRLIPGLPMTSIFTSRWSQDSHLTPEQSHQMFLTRLNFIPAASAYSTWPLAYHLGDQDSGKSTGFELVLTWLQGKEGSGQALPAKEDALIAGVTNKSYILYDNIDGANLDDPRKAGFSDTLCHLATGAEITMRKLYTTNDDVSYSIRNHAAFTSRVNVFSRSDVMRRCIQLHIAPGDNNTKVEKSVFFNAVLENRAALTAEYILRAQNILRAHLQFGKKSYRYQSSMAEYEAFTLRCAEYEGTLEETQVLWASYMRQYAEAITASNAMVFAIRLWLGKSPDNAGREVSSATLFAECRNIHEELGQPFVYKAPNAFGSAVVKQASNLGVLGFVRQRSNSAMMYTFKPSRQELQVSRDVYVDLAKGQASRPSKWDMWSVGSPSTASKTTPHFTDEEMDATLAALDDDFRMVQ